MVSVIIVSWQVRDLLEKTIRSLFRTQQDVGFEVIVVDNASGDGTPEMVRKKFPRVRMIANHRNRGFAAACNQGARVAAGKYLLFLNDDTEVFDHTLDACAHYLAAHESVGVLGCTIVNKDGSVQPSVRRLPTTCDQAAVLLKLHHFFPGLLKRYLWPGFDYAKTQKVEQVMGAFFMVPQKAFERMGGFDERFFIWFEEVDFCARAPAFEYEVVYFSGAAVYHVGGASFAQLGAVKEQKMFNKSLLYYFSMHHPWPHRAVLKAASVISIALAFLVSVFDNVYLKRKSASRH